MRQEVDHQVAHERAQIGAGHRVVDVRVAHDTVHGVDVKRVLTVTVVVGVGTIEGDVLLETVRREEAFLDHLDEALEIKITDEHLTPERQGLEGCITRGGCHLLAAACRSCWPWGDRGSEG